VKLNSGKVSRCVGVSLKSIAICDSDYQKFGAWPSAKNIVVKMWSISQTGLKAAIHDIKIIIIIIAPLRF